MEGNDVKRVHEKLLKANLVNSYGVSGFIVFTVFFQGNKPVQYWAFQMVHQGLLRAFRAYRSAQDPALTSGAYRWWR